MIIRKLFKFENAHIVRNCSSDRCKFSIHGHSYKIEVLLESDRLDNGQMVYDFGLMKGIIKDFIDSFDHAIAFWDKDDVEYIEAIKKHSARWVSLPVSPSAEQFARFFYLLVDEIIKNTILNNGERGIEVNSVIVHETDTGYAQAFCEDVYTLAPTEKDSGRWEGLKPFIDLYLVEFSSQVVKEWGDPTMFYKLLQKTKFINPVVDQQVEA